MVELGRPSSSIGPSLLLVFGVAIAHYSIKYETRPLYHIIQARVSNLWAGGLAPSVAYVSNDHATTDFAEYQWRTRGQTSLNWPPARSSYKLPCSCL